LDKTYGLLIDADMKLDVKNFNKNDLTKNSYSMIQENRYLEYFNTRIIQLSQDWKCVGVTHEYWSTQSVDNVRLTKDQIYINDVGDGGCKDDKTQRDIRLLEQGIKDEPNNPRYYFYLAQSYKDCGNDKKAIELYKKRIKLGGWYEEVWYSHYMIAKCHLRLKNIEKFEQWALKAYKYRNTRAEPIYELVKYFRENSEHYKAYHYYLIGKKITYPKEDLLFLEKDVYSFKFDYEYSILQYYVFPNERIQGLKHAIQYYNTYSTHNQLVFDNMAYYIPSILKDAEYHPLDIVHVETEYYPSSVSLLKMDDKLLANIRFVNYRIRPNGSYVYDGKVRTKNAYMYYNDDMRPISEIRFMNGELSDVPKRNSTILGLEDIRLSKTNDSTQPQNACDVYYTASTMEYSNVDKIRIIRGKYNLNTNTYENNVCLNPPTDTSCEKNWTFVDDRIIYKWFPLEVGKLVDNKLVILTSKPSPSIFNRYRGSTNPVEWKNQFWMITHGIMDTLPRKYFHQIVVLDKNLDLVKYTVPFYFDKFAIEYCLGFIIINDTVIMTASRNDANPIVIKMKINALDKYFM
jgi:tetratricopeptide (TPR) repeat protein